MKEEHLEILARIDERTRNIERRQAEEIGRTTFLDRRVVRLENWRNYIAGALAVGTFVFAAAVGYVEKKINHSGN